MNRKEEMEALAADCELYAAVIEGIEVAPNDWKDGDPTRREPRETLLKCAAALRASAAPEEGMNHRTTAEPDQRSGHRSAELTVPVKRWWLESVIQCLQGDLPRGHIGDAVFLLRDQLQDILDRADRPTHCATADSVCHYPACSCVDLSASGLSDHQSDNSEPLGKVETIVKLALSDGEYIGRHEKDMEPAAVIELRDGATAERLKAVRAALAPATEDGVTDWVYKRLGDAVNAASSPASWQEMALRRKPNTRASIP